MAGARWAPWPLRGSPWVLKYLYCHQMITQPVLRATKGFWKKSKFEIFSSVTNNLHNSTFGAFGVPMARLHRPTGHYMGPHGCSSTRIVIR